MKGTLSAAPALPAALLAVSVAAVLLPPPARSACCYFAAREKDIHQPGQKAFITWDPAAKLESFTVQPKFEGNAVDFGMVIPTPSRPRLDEMPRDFFKDLAIYTILLPLPQPIWTGLEPVLEAARAGAVPVSRGASGKRAAGVRVLESGVVGSLDYKIIVAEAAAGLYDWLKENGYSYAGDEATLDFYIQKKWFFTVMKIDPAQMKKAPSGAYTGEVTPTRFTFRSEKCIYPLKITQISVKDRTDALIYVQAPSQMDLEGDLSWQHSFRVMALTGRLKGLTPEEQEELARRNDWIARKKQGDPEFETTKLEWAKELGEGEMAVLEEPLKHYAQAGAADLPAGHKVIPLDQFLKEVKAEYLKTNKELSDYARKQLVRWEDQYQAGKGLIVKDETMDKDAPGPRYTWYPHRDAPADDVKGLSRLKGHLRSGQWITKIRKVLRPMEMSDDLALVPVEEKLAQSYVRILPTSPP